MRRISKDAVEDYRALDVRKMAKAGVLVPGYHGFWVWQEGGRQVASIELRTTAETLRLSYHSNSRRYDYWVHLERTPCHYGGFRPWFLCPAVGCGRRIAKLYGGAVFACRHCHQLNYASQQCNKADRALNASWRLRQRLGCRLGYMDIPADFVARPKGMHQARFLHLQARLRRYEAEAEQNFMKGTLRFLDRCRRHGLVADN